MKDWCCIRGTVLYFLSLKFNFSSSSFSETLPSATSTKPEQPLPFVCRLTAAPLGKYVSQSLYIRLGMSV